MGALRERRDARAAAAARNPSMSPGIRSALASARMTGVQRAREDAARLADAIDQEMREENEAYRRKLAPLEERKRQFSTTVRAETEAFEKVFRERKADCERLERESAECKEAIAAARQRKETSVQRLDADLAGIKRDEAELVSGHEARMQALIARKQAVAQAVSAAHAAAFRGSHASASPARATKRHASKSPTKRHASASPARATKRHAKASTKPEVKRHASKSPTKRHASKSPTKRHAKAPTKRHAKAAKAAVGKKHMKPRRLKGVTPSPPRSGTRVIPSPYGGTIKRGRPEDRYGRAAPEKKRGRSASPAKGEFTSTPDAPASPSRPFWKFWARDPEPAAAAPSPRSRAALDRATAWAPSRSSS